MKKTLNKLIGEYVERNEIGGLAEFFRAYVGDLILEEEITLKKIKDEWLSLNLRNDNKKNWGKELNKFGLYIQSLEL